MLFLLRCVLVVFSSSVAPSLASFGVARENLNILVGFAAVEDHSGAFEGSFLTLSVCVVVPGPGFSLGEGGVMCVSRG